MDTDWEPLCIDFNPINIVQQSSHCCCGFDYECAYCNVPFDDFDKLFYDFHYYATYTKKDEERYDQSIKKITDAFLESLEVKSLKQSVFRRDIWQNIPYDVIKYCYNCQTFCFRMHTSDTRCCRIYKDYVISYNNKLPLFPLDELDEYCKKMQSGKLNFILYPINYTSWKENEITMRTLPKSSHELIKEYNENRCSIFKKVFCDDIINIIIDFTMPLYLRPRKEYIYEDNEVYKDNEDDNYDFFV